MDERLKGLDAPIRTAVLEAVKTPKEKRTANHKKLLRTHSKAVEITDDDLAKRYPEFAAYRERVQKTVAEREKDRPSAPEKIATYVETDAHPATHHLLKRGLHGKPGEEVQPGVPARLITAKNGFTTETKLTGLITTGRRTAFAKWVTSPENPSLPESWLTASGNITSEQVSWLLRITSVIPVPSPRIKSCSTTLLRNSSVSTGASSNFID